MTDPDWLDAIPTGRPAVIVADGMMAFLTQDELVSLWNRLISHFPSGEIVFNSYTRFAIWIAKHARGTKSVADLVKFPGMDDPRAPEGWNPKLQLVREILLSREPEVAEFPPAWRRYHRLAAHSTAWSRTGTIVLHYRFEAGDHPGSPGEQAVHELDRDRALPDGGRHALHRAVPDVPDREHPGEAGLQRQRRATERPDAPRHSGPARS